MKLYIISGLGADYKVLEKLKFPNTYEAVFLDWLTPKKEETLEEYSLRMASRINKKEDYCILGYSFGGIIAQEIDKILPAKKVIILGSIKSDKEKSLLIKLGEYTKIPRIIPEYFFNQKMISFYAAFRKIIDPKNPKILEYFRVRNPYYLKWSIMQISQWKQKPSKKIIQILGDKDIVFPIKNCNPDYIIKGGTHLFPATKPKEVSVLLERILKGI